MKKCLVIVNTHKEESLAMEKVISAFLSAELKLLLFILMDSARRGSLKGMILL